MRPSRFGFVLLIAAASCTSAHPDIKVRAAGSQVEVKGLGEARSQLALGNVGLALEGFRTVLRDAPGNTDAAVGIAHCYEQMGRFDLSRNWFETALASAPDNVAVLDAFADSLQSQGKLSEAASVRSEAARLASATAIHAPSATAAPAPLLAVGDIAQTVTIALPPPAPAEPATATPKPQLSGQAALAESTLSGPRLERLSLGEVALITRTEPVWTAQLIGSSQRSATFRWVELKPVARLLNAARVEGLAARTREKLASRGWTKLAIGDAPAVRSKTLVLYPEYRRGMALRLAAQFGFTHLQSFSGSEIVVLLGRDAASPKDPRST
jgi:tetratricopeptide (TPR) repeat protein